MSISLFNILESENIIFKPLSMDDAQEIHNYASDKDVSRFIGWKLMHTLDETQEHIEEMMMKEAVGTHLYASVFLKSTQEIIGTVMIFNFDQEARRAEIGYVFHKDYWGQGYGAESVKLMNDFAFKTLKLHKLNAYVTDSNIGSVRVLERNNFELEGRFKDHYFIEGRYYDGLYFGKIESE